MDPALPRRVVPSPDVLFREIDGEAVMLNLQSERYFGLDEIGTRIWQLLDENHDVETVIARMLDEFDVPETQLRGDLATLISELAEAGLVTILSEEENRGAP